MAKLLTLIFSAICVFVSLISLLTLMVDDQCNTTSSSTNRQSKTSFIQLAYNVPPFFFTFCCVFYSFGYFLSQLINPEDYCLRNDENSNVLILANEGHRNLPCIIVYLLVFFFGGSISSWWTVSTFLWYLSACSSSSSASFSSSRKPLRKPDNFRCCIISPAAISTLCHSFAWGVPATLTVVGIVSHQIESDELLSVCLPGAGFKDSSLLIFILIPESIQLLFGFLFYVLGWIFSGCIKKPNQGALSKRTKQEMNNLKTADKLQFRVKLFGALYMTLKVRFP